MALYKLADRAPIVPDREQYWVAENASVIGDVTLGVDVGVWFGAVLRGDNEPIHIGARSNIQDLSLLHTDPGFPLEIGEGCTIGHRSILHGCTIGENTLIGMGATIMNGARIGNNCLIGANTLIPENKAFPDNSLIIGMPGKLVRELDDDAVRELQRSANSYVANWQRFQANLERIG